MSSKVGQPHADATAPKPRPPLSADGTPPAAPPNPHPASGGGQHGH
jgi:hypothetical protein